VFLPRLPYKQEVAGSSPALPTIFPKIKKMFFENHWSTRVSGFTFGLQQDAPVSFFLSRQW
jgi:hypothetical protein